MTDSDVVYVAVAPPAPVEAGIVEKVAAIAGKDVFGTRVLLNSKIPRILGYYGSLQAAESVAEQLSTLGLVAVVCGQAELRHPSPARFRAHTLKLKEGEIAFWDRRGQSRVVEARSVFLILKGMARTQVEKETTNGHHCQRAPQHISGGGLRQQADRSLQGGCAFRHTGGGD